jgi:hypothetical protein
MTDKAKLESPQRRILGKSSTQGRNIANAVATKTVGKTMKPRINSDGMQY